MTFVRSSFAFTAAALVFGCSPALAEPKLAQEDAGHAQSPHKPKSTRPDGGVPPKKGRVATGTPNDEAQSAGSPAAAAPKFSNDACKKDEDCAPVAMCHPDRCVGAGNAGTMAADMMCSMECRSGTVDCGYNHCACVASSAGKKLCALVPGPKHR